MLKSFWFYFLSIPVLFSLITFSLPINFVEDFINTPLFADAVEYCKDVVNDDPYETEYGTMQDQCVVCLLYTSPSPRDRTRSRMPSSA